VSDSLHLLDFSACFIHCFYRINSAFQHTIIILERVHILNEVLNGIRVVKFFSWEGAIKKHVANMREQELVVLTRIAYVIAFNVSLVMMAAPIIQPILIFSTYTQAQGRSLDAAVAFTTIALFNILRLPFAQMPMAFNQFQNCLVSSGRISRFLLKKSIQEYVEIVEPLEQSTTAGKYIAENPCSIFVVQNASLSWGKLEPLMESSSKEKCCSISPVSLHSRRRNNKSQSVSHHIEAENGGKVGTCEPTVSNPIFAPTGDMSTTSLDFGNDASTAHENESQNALLSEINIVIKEGSLVAIVGPVGSGKSSLLSALSGEMQLLHGSIARKKCSVSIVSQVPWVVNDTLRDNILFGKPFDSERYNNVMAACCLENDVSMLPGGDKCEIGEKGINLSGGQKARVALARAAYTDSDICLLDDPLSAVDAQVGKKIFEDCVR
jgi:ABC-type multidrug transport system fused ATPase/permease subunit